jgi:hypothetical protein
VRHACTRTLVEFGGVPDTLEAEDIFKQYFTVLENEKAELVRLDLIQLLARVATIFDFKLVWERIRLWTPDTDAEKRLLAISILCAIDVDNTDDIRHHLTEILEIIAKFLQDKTLLHRGIAVKAMYQVIKVGELRKKDIHKFSALFPLVLRSVSDLLNAGDLNNAGDFLRVLLYLIPCGNGVLFKDGHHIQNMLSAMYQVASAKLEVLMSERACEVITVLMNTQPKMVTRFPKFTETMIQLCYDLVLEDFHQIWKIESNVIALYTQVASRCIMKMSKTCKMETLHTCIKEIATVKLQGNENERNAILGIFYFFVLGCTIDNKDLSSVHDDMTGTLIKYTKDENPKARVQAFNTIALLGYKENAPYNDAIWESLERLLDDVDPRVHAEVLLSSVCLLEQKQFHEHKDYKSVMDKLFPKIVCFVKHEDNDIKRYALDALSCANGNYLAANYDSFIGSVRNQKEEILELRFFSFIMMTVPLSVIEPDIERIITLVFNLLAFKDINQFEHMMEICLRVIESLNNRFAPYTARFYQIIKETFMVTRPVNLMNQLQPLCARLCLFLFKHRLMTAELTKDIFASLFQLFQHVFNADYLQSISIWSEVLITAVKMNPTQDVADPAIEVLLQLMVGSKTASIVEMTQVINDLATIFKLAPPETTVKYASQIVIVIQESIDLTEYIIEQEDVDIDHIEGFYEDAASLAGVLVERSPSDIDDLGILIAQFVQLIPADPNNMELRFGFLQLIRRLLLGGGEKEFMKKWMVSFYGGTFVQETLIATDVLGLCLVSEIYGLLALHAGDKLQTPHYNHILQFLTTQIALEANEDTKEIISTAAYGFINSVITRMLDIKLIETHIVPKLPLLMTTDENVFNYTNKVYRLLVTVCMDCPSVFTPKMKRKLERIDLTQNLEEETRKAIRDGLSQLAFDPLK